MKSKQRAVCAVFLSALLLFSLLLILLPAKSLSAGERRPLAQLVGYEEWLSGSTGRYSRSLSGYFSWLESVLQDQAPGRDALRRLRALTKRYLFGERDTDGYYAFEGSLCKLDSSLSQEAVLRAAERFGQVYERFFAGTGAHLYCSVVPDKNVFAAPAGGYPHYNFDALRSLLRSALPDAFREVPLSGLTLSDYYRTDPHWRQEQLLPAADTLLGAMGADPVSQLDWQPVTAGRFTGTYAGHSALPALPDELVYLTNDILAGAAVHDYESGKTSGIYTPENLANVDPYDVYLGGARALLTIDNPAQTNGRQLVVFRDSFGSSLVPLLIPSYSRIVVADLRYVTPESLGRFVSFQPGCDVLFLVSCSVLNSYGVFG